MLKGSFNKANKYAFLGSLKYALVHEMCRSSISDLYVASRAHKLACFAQSPDLVQTNKQTDSPNNLQSRRLLYPRTHWVIMLLSSVTTLMIQV